MAGGEGFYSGNVDFGHVALMVNSKGVGMCGDGWIWMVLGIAYALMMPLLL